MSFLYPLGLLGLIGIPILISIILVVLYTPWVIVDRRKAKKTTKV